MEGGENTFEVSKQQIKRMSEMKLLGVREPAALLRFLAATALCWTRFASSWTMLNVTLDGLYHPLPSINWKERLERDWTTVVYALPIARQSVGHSLSYLCSGVERVSHSHQICLHAGSITVLSLEPMFGPCCLVRLLSCVSF